MARWFSGGRIESAEASVSRSSCQRYASAAPPACPSPSPAAMRQHPPQFAPRHHQPGPPKASPDKYPPTSDCCLEACMPAVLFLGYPPTKLVTPVAKTPFSFSPFILTPLLLSSPQKSKPPHAPPCFGGDPFLCSKRCRVQRAAQKRRYQLNNHHPHETQIPTPPDAISSGRETPTYPTKTTTPPLTPPLRPSAAPPRCLYHTPSLPPSLPPIRRPSSLYRHLPSFFPTTPPTLSAHTKLPEVGAVPNTLKGKKEKKREQLQATRGTGTPKVKLLEQETYITSYVPARTTEGDAIWIRRGEPTSSGIASRRAGVRMCSRRRAVPSRGSCSTMKPCRGPGPRTR